MPAIPILALLLALGGLGLARPAAAADPAGPGVPACVEAAVNAIQKRYETVADLSARFEQTTRSVAYGTAGTASASRGEVVFAKPGRMRWHYEEPEESLVVSDGEWLWIYDPAAREAQKYPVTGGWLSGAAVQFLLGEGEILRDFQVTAESCDAERAHLSLLPRRPASYEMLRILADARSGDLLETEVVDLLGNVTRIAFQDVRTNQGPSPELFRFQAPPGVRVVELESPGADP